MGGFVLSGEGILELIKTTYPLVEGYLDLDVQLQPNGFDLTLGQVHQFASPGAIGAGSGPSDLSMTTALSFDTGGCLYLPEGAYLVMFNEIVNLPRHIMALGRPRSSLLRSGVALHTAVWDAGYRGRSQSLLTVHNPHGYQVAKGARLLQLVFLCLERSVGEGYRGGFQGENLEAGGSGLTNESHDREG